MAVDTQEKRMNASKVGRPFMRSKLAVGSTDEQSRIASGHGYGGNPLSAVVSTIVAQARSLHRFVFTRVFGRVN